MRKLVVAAFVVLLGVVIPLGYLNLVRTFLFYPKPTLISIWEDNTFSTHYEDPVWVDSDFSGWNIKWTLRQTSTGYGFVGHENLGDLYATFMSYNASNGRGVSGIMIEKTIGNVDTTAYPYLVIKHRESSSDSSLMFSFGVVDENENYFYEKGYHTTLSWECIDYDLRKLYNGTISRVSILFTNDFNPYYAGGLQHVFLQKIGIYQKNAAWRSTSNRPIDIMLSSYQGNLEVLGRGNLTAGTIVSAQRNLESTINLTNARYLKVLINASGINVAARITVWTSLSDTHLILLKTYDDNDSHLEIIDLKYFGISGSQLQMLELGWQQVCDSMNSVSVVKYSQLSLNQMVYSP